MGVHIRSLGVEVPGQVVRTYDAATKMTTIVLDESQVRGLHSELGAVIAIFDSLPG